MSPVSSACSRKSRGARRPRSGCCQRTSASTPMHVPFVSEMTGWKKTRNSLRATARCSAFSISCRSRARSRISSSNTSYRDFARAPWRGTSRHRRRGRALPAARARSTPIAMPMLALTNCSSSSTTNGSRSASRRRSATPIACWSAALGTRSSHSTVNSSPPNRDTTSPGRSTAASRRASALSSSSPASCPRLSFTTLNRSRSRNKTASAEPGALRSPECVLEQLAEQRAVGERRERIVVGLVRQPIVERVPLDRDRRELQHRVDHRFLGGGRRARDSSR